MQAAEALPQRSAWRTKPLAALSLAAVIMLASIAMLDVTGGPVSETVCTVKSVSHPTATVQLPGGSLVEAQIRKGVDPPPGDRMAVLVHERTLTGARSYEVMGPPDEHK